MSNKEPIQIFEYDYLRVGQQGFDLPHLDALVKYNDAHKGKFFTLHHQAVRFQQYVGVIQAGDLTIEILPKIGKETDPGGNKTTWQQVLIDMLRECNWMKVHSHEKAALQFKFNSILEAYLELFITECETLLHLGLIKKYRQEDGNVMALKGKLLFSENIQKNLVHQERFYTRHQAYDRNNIYNQILFKALKLIPEISDSPFLKDRVYRLLMAFPELDIIKVNEATFQNLVFDRKTIAYQEGIEIAAMIILNYRPDVSSGQNHILAILFDMNNLWEEYVYRQIVKNNNRGWYVVPQEYQTVWRNGNSDSSKGIKPDIVIDNGIRKLIVDTKWKLPEDDLPADSDLKQMFMYNEYWDGANAVLLYAKIKGEVIYEPGYFITGGRVKSTETGYRHLCGVMKVSVLDEEDNLLVDFGNVINKKINKEFLEK